VFSHPLAPLNSGYFARTFRAFCLQLLDRQTALPDRKHIGEASPPDFEDRSNRRRDFRDITTSLSSFFAKGWGSHPQNDEPSDEVPIGVFGRSRVRDGIILDNSGAEQAAGTRLDTNTDVAGLRPAAPGPRHVRRPVGDCGVVSTLARREFNVRVQGHKCEVWTV
jgi:hypothetical protein